MESKLKPFLNERFLITVSVLGGYVAVSLLDTHGKDITNVLTTMQNALLMCLTYYFHSAMTEQNNAK